MGTLIERFADVVERLQREGDGHLVRRVDGKHAKCMGPMECRACSQELIDLQHALAQVLPMGISDSFGHLALNMHESTDYAWVWQSNLAMSIVAAGVQHQTANEAAAKFMQIAFSVDVRKSAQWATLEKQWAASPPAAPALTVFDPKDGERDVYPSEARQYREWHGRVAWLYNPFTGDARSPQDIGTDPFGLLIVAPAKAPAEGHHV